VLSHLQEEKMMLLGYSTLQDLISDALTTEQQRLCFILERNMTKKVELMLDCLLMNDGGLYALTSLKKDPKSFRTKHIKAEIKKVHENKKLYEFASRHLSKLKLTNQAIQYYASLADHYSIDRLRDLPKLHTQLYLICYVYYRYQQVVDNLVISFVYLTEKYYAEAKAMAKDIIFDEKIPVSSDSKQAAKVLEFYIDKSISDNTTFGSVRQQAFKLLNEDKFSDVIQFIIGSLFDFERTCWDELSKNRSKITVNIRPIFKALNFACSSDDSTLLAGIQFLKKRFIDENKSEVPPVDCVPPKKRVYLTNNDGTDIEMHRYEFMVYHLMKEQIESGQTFINDSVSFKNFSEYLIDDKRWKHKAKLLKELGYEHLLVPINEILKRHEEELEPLIKDINSRITNGANEGISIKKKGDEISWTLPYNKQAEKANNPLFTSLPRIRIADLLHFVDRENHFMQAFTHIKPHHAKGDRDITAIIACLIANGTNLGVYKMAGNCDLNYDRMQGQLKNYIRPETLQEANDIVSNAIADLPIFKYWDIHAERLHASVDGQKFGTRLHTFMARYSAKYFGIGKGVVAYTLSTNHIPVNAKVISANQHESHFLFDILQNNTSDIDPDWVSGDGHSINQINFLLLDIIGKQFAPHFKRVKLKSQTLYGFKDESDYQDYLIKPTNKVDKKLIESNWDDMLRVLVSLLLGEVSQHIIVSKLSSYKHKNQTKLALWELDKIIMSKYLLRYIDDPIIRQNVRRALNRGEAYHQLRRTISNVNGQKFRGTSPQELEIWNDSARLLANCIIYYNAKMLSGLVTDLQTTMNETEISKLLAHISPIAWEHINLSGHYEFGEKRLEIDINKLVARLNIGAPGLGEAGYIPPKGG
jgi:TnpA family transposase